MTLDAPVDVGPQRGAQLRFHHLLLTNETATYPFGNLPEGLPRQRTSRDDEPRFRPAELPHIR
jgi:hypothetical protein